uniref:G_PROTEIN_RECEP_F1_2 domain-containing protein n=1 Tax=Parastrongyloides trichosuri TaxID=131310 RepID=A0A0N4Z9K0_PARTI
MGHCFLVVINIAIIGNVINIVAYNRKKHRSFRVVEFLAFRLYANTLAMIFLIPHTLRTMGVWNASSPIDYYYWFYWLTVMMTLECFFSVHNINMSRTIWTPINVSVSYSVICISGTLLTVIFIINRRVQFYKECGLTQVYVYTSKFKALIKIEEIITLLNLIITILIPLAFITSLTIAIVYILVFKKRRSGLVVRLSSEKKCVIRITLITTILFFLSEFPAIPVYYNAFFEGPKVVNTNDNICIWYSASHFSGLFNASLSFYIYFILSKRFRSTVYETFREYRNRITKFFGCKKRQARKHKTNTLRNLNRTVNRNLREEESFEMVERVRNDINPEIYIENNNEILNLNHNPSMSSNRIEKEKKYITKVILESEIHPVPSMSQLSTIEEEETENL